MPPPKPAKSAIFGNLRPLQLLFKVTAGENEGCSAAIPSIAEEQRRCRRWYLWEAIGVAERYLLLVYI